MTDSAASQLVKAECRHIPRGDYAQNELRMVYAITRQHRLARDGAASPLAALQEAMRSVAARHPGFRLTYDTAFFSDDQPGSGSGSQESGRR